jgi:hypothetical protein
MSTSPFQQIKQDITDAEAQLISELRKLGTDAKADATKIVADGKAAGSTLVAAFENVVKGGTTPVAPTKSGV